MKKRVMTITFIICLATAATIYAGTGYFMKCRPDPEKPKKTDKTKKTDKPVKPCGYETSVSFGGGMFYNQITGYCKSCKKFVYLSWTKENLPDGVGGDIKHRPRPKPLGEVWDSKTGEVAKIHACPKCKGPFLEIKNVKDLKRCPGCNKSHFDIDKSKPRIAID
jgi:hypothetical protein